MAGRFSVSGLLFVADYVTESVVKDPHGAVVLADYST